MPEPKQPDILLVDDGELDDLARQLTAVGLAFERALGPRESGALAPPVGVLITTPRRAAAVRRGSPPEAQPGRPIRIVAVDEDTASNRRLLRRTGFHLVVRLPVHESIWRLLADDALYAGSERRDDPRIAVGSSTSVDTDPEAPPVLLMDISNRGCRLLGHEAFEVGQTLSVQVPDREGDEEVLRVPGSVARIGRIDAASGEPSHMSAVLFEAGLDEAMRRQLGVRLNRWSVGPASLCDGTHGPAVPACESSEIPGLMLDEETDPAIRVETAVGCSREIAKSMAEPDRRARARGQFAVPVMARGRSKRRMLIGRDLSASGMRVEPVAGIHVGERFMFALHGASSGKPIVVTATVARDDGDAGIALRFDELSESRAELLDKLVACLPDLDSLDEGEAFGLGAVVSELLGDDEPDVDEEN